MVDKSSAENLDNPANTHLENPSEEILPTNNTDAINPNQETENMEVHHHPDLHHKPKKWKEYFIEFLMIFLAVTMGFIAENIREHIVEHEREKKYMQSLLIDLKTDLINIETVQKQNLLAKQVGDSLFLLLTLPDYTNETNSIYYYGRVFSARTFFNMREGTLKQLNNAGGLRLIHHQEIVDSLEAYQYTYAELLKLQELKEIQLLNYRDVMCKVFDVRILETMVTGEKITRPVGNPKIFSENKEFLNELLMKAHFVKRNNAQLLTMLAEMKQMDMNLQAIINKEYHLE
jgi:hypothetical protein